MEIDKTLNILLIQSTLIIEQISNLNYPTSQSFLYFELIFIIFFLIMIPILYFLTRDLKEKKRRIINEYARAKGFRYIGDNSTLIAPLLYDTPLTTGKTWADYGVMHYIDEKVITTIVWYNKVGSGKYSHLFIYQIAVIPVKFKESGNILMRKEYKIERLANIFGYNDLDFEDQTFSNRYYVRAYPAKFGYDFFHPRMMEFFLFYPQYYVIVRTNHIVIFKLLTHKDLGFELKIPKDQNLREIHWMEEARNIALSVERLIPSFMRANAS